MKILFTLLLVLVLSIFLFGISVISFLLRVIFGIGRTNPASRSGQTNNGQHQQRYQQTAHQRSDDYTEEATSGYTSGKKQKKIFTKDDGEYVDFEEIKE